MVPRKTTKASEITTSICPISRIHLNSQTPRLDPITPPASRTDPILKSTVPRRQWASTPETEAATIWLASVPTATAGGTPVKIKSGVIKNPPPTPKSPERRVTPAPMPSNKKMLSDISAMGR